MANLIKFKDVTNQEIWINPENPTLAILIPSPLSPGGDGQCRILASGVVSVVTRVEAERFLEEVNGG